MCDKGDGTTRNLSNTGWYSIEQWKDAFMSSVNMSQHDGLTRPSCIRFALGLDNWGVLSFLSFGKNVTTEVIAIESENRAEVVYIRMYRSGNRSEQLF